MKPELKAIHWLRSRQEENELGYWLSFVAYDQRDRSLVNKAYLLYLVIFFFIWFMMMFFFFAKFGGMALSLISPDQAANTSLTIEWIVLACWNLYTIIQAAKRSPIIFSENDKTLICQTPVNRRALVIRWFWMPWFKSALLFWIMALVLGFSTAELQFAGTDPSTAFFSYVGFGLRAIIQIIPVHLAFYAFQWIIGTFRLQKNHNKNWVIYPAIILSLIPFALLLLENSFVNRFGSSLLTLFMNPNYINGTISSPYYWGLCAAVIFLGLLLWVSNQFNLNRAAQETSEIELMATAKKYGLTDQFEQRRLQNKLSNKRKIPLTARYKGDLVMVWKNQLQNLRGWSWKQILPLLTIFSISMGLPLVPGILSKMLALFFMVIQIGPLLTPRLRSDLACWPILQQLPIRKPKILAYDLLSNLPTLLITSILGLGISALISHTFAFDLLVLLPGLLAIIGCTAAIDIFRKSKSDLLINGSVPSVGTQGVILGVIGTVIPVWVVSTFSSPAGVLLSVLISLAISWGSFKFAVFSFKNIKS